ncbi:MAG: hypothetical protein HXY38_07680 [Chloroflexi bacterium]|nr:hypothetical protein [Chloroflexota bacterium]
MLASITHTVNLLAMAVSLWMALYLFGRGFPNRATLRASLALMAIAVFFLDTYNRFHNPYKDTPNLRAALLVIAFVCWYSATFTLLTDEQQKKFRRMKLTLYWLAASAVALLVTAGVGVARSPQEMLYTARLEWDLPTVLYGAAQLSSSAGVLFNLFVQRRIRQTEEGRLFFTASWFLVFALGYGIFALAVPARTPRVIEDGFVFCGIALLGLSVARYQSLVERRTIWQDFAITFTGISFITALYLFIAIAVGVHAQYWGNIAALVISTHALYDIGREAVERWRMRQEKRLRVRRNQAQMLEDEALRLRLDKELTLLLQALNASQGLIAIREEERLTVAATRNSLPLGRSAPEYLSAKEGLTRIKGEPDGLAYVVPIFEGMQPIALIAVGHSNAKLEYSSGELELLEEFSEQVGTFISIINARKVSMHFAAARVTKSLTAGVEADFSKSVEDALRHFADVLYLGRSSLAEWAEIQSKSHVECGKRLQHILRAAVQALRPEGERPPEPLPREWYNFVVLYDAYIQGVPNREVMARLYVSEGTFHRTRRHAVHGVARWLAEQKRVGRLNSF